MELSIIIELVKLAILTAIAIAIYLNSSSIMSWINTQVDKIGEKIDIGFSNLDLD